MPDRTPQRPLSPHLQVYRPQLTSITSILHRITGAALAAGFLLIAWWLLAAAIGEEAYNAARAFATSPLGLFMLFGWTIALFYHMLNGIRHLIWDTVHLFKLRNAYIAGYIVLALTVILTLMTWYSAYNYSDLAMAHLNAAGH